jgi:hypothetical protein
MMLGRRNLPTLIEKSSPFIVSILPTWIPATAIFPFLSVRRMGAPLWPFRAGIS